MDDQNPASIVGGLGGAGQSSRIQFCLHLVLRTQPMRREVGANNPSHIHLQLREYFHWGQTFFAELFVQDMHFFSPGLYPLG
jgi:hypothetical protein